MDKAEIHGIFRQLRGVSWAARSLGVHKSILIRWLRGEKRSTALEGQTEKIQALANELQRTEGKAAKGVVNGSSVRRKISRMRRRQKGFLSVRNTPLPQTCL